MKKTISRLVSGVILAINVTCYADDVYLKELYQYEQWVGTIKTNYLRIIKIPTIIFNDLNVSEDLTIRSGSYMFQPTNTPFNVHLRVYETPSVLDAHEALIDFFSTCSAIQPFPSGASIGIDLGDHCYTGYPIGETNSVSFVRNNVFVNVSSRKLQSSVYEIAKQIDQHLLSISTSSDSDDVQEIQFIFDGEAQQINTQNITVVNQTPSTDDALTPTISTEENNTLVSPKPLYRIWPYFVIGVLLLYAITYFIRKIYKQKNL